jgi:adenosine kinase
VQHARELAAAGIPFIFDPGQGLPKFNGEELMEFVNAADYVTVNDYEGRMLQERTGRSIEELATLVKAFIVTMGARGSMIYADGHSIEIPCVRPTEVVDPTGCGDAFRAGLLYGIVQGYAWEKTGRLASLLGALKIAHRGGQNHRYNRDQIGKLYADAFGAPLW